MTKTSSMKQNHKSGLSFPSAECRIRRLIRTHEDANIIEGKWSAHSSTIYLEVEAVLITK